MIKKRVVSALLAIAMILSCMIPLAACGASAELSSIEITAEPTKTTYIAGEKFDPAGMTVTAKYDDDTTRELTAEEWTYDLTGELKTSDRNVVISYTENEVTKTARQRITVTNDAVSAVIKTHATKTEYLPGEVFDPAGMVLSVTYQDGSTKDVEGTDPSVSCDTTPLAVGRTTVEITVGDVVVEESIVMLKGIFVEAEDGVIDSGSGREFNDSSDATGGDIYLCMGIPGLIDVVDNSSPTALSVFRDKVKNLAYTVVNSNAVQGLCAGAIISYGMSPWAVWLLVADIAIGVLLAAGVVWIVLRARDEKKHPEKYKRKEKI